MNLEWNTQKIPCSKNTKLQHFFLQCLQFQSSPLPCREIFDDYFQTKFLQALLSKYSPKVFSVTLTVPDP